MGIKRPRVFFDVQIGGIPVGRSGGFILLAILLILVTTTTNTYLTRIVMQLFADVCPRTVENFRWTQ